MFCGKCQQDIGKCTCPDIDERLRDLTRPGGYLVARWCAVCDKHYARCKCDNPIWVTKGG